MKIDQELLEAFETGLDPLNLEASAVPATVLGYGEISTVFQIRGDSSIAYKRMSLFDSRAAAERYRHQYQDYCRRLKGQAVAREIVRRSVGQSSINSAAMGEISRGGNSVPRWAEGGLPPGKPNLPVEKYLAWVNLTGLC